MGSESGELNADDQMIGGDLKTCPSRREKLVHAVYRYSMMFFVLPPADNLMGGHLKLWLPRGPVLLPQEGQDFVA